MKSVVLYTDGACSGNPGAGGWGAILDYQGQRKELSGGENSTTNNRMELMAAIKGLSALKEPCHVKLVSDSKYVIDGLSRGWAANWKKNGWKRNKRERALNSDLWEQLLNLIEKHEMEYEWVKGHSGHPENQRCDDLATAAIASL